jgi:hypothetical protein
MTIFHHVIFSSLITRPKSHELTSRGFSGVRGIKTVSSKSLFLASGIFMSFGPLLLLKIDCVAPLAACNAWRMICYEDNLDVC